MKRRPNDLSAVIRHLAHQPATPVSLKNLYKYAAQPSPLQLLKNAQFLHDEIPIRISQRVEELHALPHGPPGRGRCCLSANPLSLPVACLHRWSGGAPE